MSTNYKGIFSKYGWWNQGTLDATAAAADAALGVTERFFQTVKALDNIVYYIVPPVISSLDIRLSMLTANHAAIIDVWAGSVVKRPSDQPSKNCMLQRMFTLSIVAGTQQGITSTDLFADQIAPSNDVTLGGVGRVEPGANQLASAHFGIKGSNLIVFHGHTTCQSNCKIWLRGFSDA